MERFEYQPPDIPLRKLELSDVGYWYGYLSIPYVVEHTSWNLSSITELEELVKTFNTNEPDSQIRFAIIDKVSDDLIGTIGFHSYVNFSAEIAYDIHPDYWNRGVATRACELAIDWGFSQFGLTRIQACALASNIGSVIVLRKCGFVQGQSSIYRVVRGKRKEFLVYSKESRS